MGTEPGGKIALPDGVILGQVWLSLDLVILGCSCH